MNKRVPLFLIAILIITVSGYSQSNFNYLIDFDRCTYPIHLEGKVQAIHFSESGDTIKHFRYTHELTIDKMGDTLVLYDYYRQRYLGAKYEIIAKDSLVMWNDTAFFNFPTLGRIVFAKKDTSGKRLKSPILHYIGVKDLRPFENVDTSFLRRFFKITGTEEEEYRRSTGVVNLPLDFPSIYYWGEEQHQKVSNQRYRYRYNAAQDTFRIIPDKVKPTYSNNMQKQDFYMVKKEESPAMLSIFIKEHHKFTGDSYKEYKVFGVYTRKTDKQTQFKNKR